MQAQPQAVEDGGIKPDSCMSTKNEMWCDWKALMQSLRLALDSKSPDSQLRKCLNECMQLYRASYTIPPTTDNILASISGRNSSLLEAAFMWLGGWRPSSAVTLVYSKMGVSMGECDKLAPSSMLSKSQLFAMEALRDQTCKAEAEISNSVAYVQASHFLCLELKRLCTLLMLVADQDMAEAFGIGFPHVTQGLCGGDSAQAQRRMDSKLMSLRTLCMQANGLRLQTLQELENLLTPKQAAQCVVAAFELAYAVRNLGNACAFKMRADSLEVGARATSEHSA